jgi:hypothetical protein
MYKITIDDGYVALTFTLEGNEKFCIQDIVDIICKHTGLHEARFQVDRVYLNPDPNSDDDEDDEG